METAVVPVHPCSTCSSVFLSKNGLDQHIINCNYMWTYHHWYYLDVTNGREPGSGYPYSCQFCSDTFFDYARLCRHLSSHENQKPASRCKCPLEFQLQDRHDTVHSMPRVHSRPAESREKPQVPEWTPQHKHNHLMQNQTFPDLDRLREELQRTVHSLPQVNTVAQDHVEEKEQGIDHSLQEDVQSTAQLIPKVVEEEMHCAGNSLPNLDGIQEEIQRSAHLLTNQEDLHDSAPSLDRQPELLRDTSQEVQMQLDDQEDSRSSMPHLESQLDDLKSLVLSSSCSNFEGMQDNLNTKPDLSVDATSFGNEDYTTTSSNESWSPLNDQSSQDYEGSTSSSDLTSSDSSSEESEESYEKSTLQSETATILGTESTVTSVNPDDYNAVKSLDSEGATSEATTGTYKDLKNVLPLQRVVEPADSSVSTEVHVAEAFSEQDSTNVLVCESTTTSVNLEVYNAVKSMDSEGATSDATTGTYKDLTNVLPSQRVVEPADSSVSTEVQVAEVFSEQCQDSTSTTVLVCESEVKKNREYKTFSVKSETSCSSAIDQQIGEELVRVPRVTLVPLELMKLEDKIKRCLQKSWPTNNNNKIHQPELKRVPQVVLVPLEKMKLKDKFKDYLMQLKLDVLEEEQLRGNLSQHVDVKEDEQKLVASEHNSIKEEPLSPKAPVVSCEGEESEKVPQILLVPLEQMNLEMGTPAQKRGRGRPRKYIQKPKRVLCETPGLVKRKRGRPRKVDQSMDQLSCVKIEPQLHVPLKKEPSEDMERSKASGLYLRARPSKLNKRVYPTYFGRTFKKRPRRDATWSGLHKAIDFKQCCNRELRNLSIRPGFENLHAKMQGKNINKTCHQNREMESPKLNHFCYHYTSTRSEGGRITLRRTSVLNTDSRKDKSAGHLTERNCLETLGEECVPLGFAQDVVKIEDQSSNQEIKQNIVPQTVDQLPINCRKSKRVDMKESSHDRTSEPGRKLLLNFKLEQVDEDFEMKNRSQQAVFRKAPSVESTCESVPRILLTPLKQGACRRDSNSSNSSLRNTKILTVDEQLHGLPSVVLEQSDSLGANVRRSNSVVQNKSKKLLQKTLVAVQKRKKCKPRWTFSCPRCRKKFLYNSDMLRHMKTNKEVIKCENCSRTFCDQIGFYRHLSRNLCRITTGN